MKFSWSIFFIIIFIEILSFLSFLSPLAQAILLILFCLTVFIIALKDLKLAVLIALTELFIGGLGRLFAWSFSGFDVSIRMGFFLVILAAVLIKIIQERRIEFFHSRFFKSYILLIFFILLGLFSGYFRGHTATYVFFDGNGFFFLGYLLSFYQAFKNKEDVESVWPFFWTAIVWLGIKTLLFFSLFSGNFTSVGSLFYKWIRDTGVGEITLLDGGFYRIFLQSQIYLVLGSILLTARKLFLFHSEEKSFDKWDFLPGAIFFSALFLSLSRSFWLGLLASLLLLFFLAIIFLRASGRQAGQALKFLLISIVSACFLTSILIFSFHPEHNPLRFFSLFTKRVSTAVDASLNSRAAQLGPLGKEIKRHWFWGSGFGQTITFRSSDPRILSHNPTGERTTYALEWGWLDLWLKIGVLGVLSYLLLIGSVWRKYWKDFQYSIFNIHDLNKISRAVGLGISIVALIIIHIFTPYLNHPLGLGWLMLIGLIADNRS